MTARDTYALENTPTLKSEQAQPAPETGPRTPEAQASDTARKLSREKALELAIAVARAADAKKAEDILILDVSRTLGIADFFVIAGARSRRQLTVVAESCSDAARALGSRARAIEGSDTGWVIADFVDVVLHVFEEQARGFYDLEHLWADAPRVPFTPAPEAPRLAAHEAPGSEDSSTSDEPLDSLEA